MPLDVKRCYLPGFIVVAVCPECGERIERDLGKHYLSYPKTGVQDISMYHETDDGDEHDWTVKVDLQLTLTAIEGCEVVEEDDETDEEE